MQSELTIISLGSNLGDSAQIIVSAAARLWDFSAEPLQRSSLWHTTPIDCPPGSPPFVNAVIVMKTLPGKTPESLLATMKALEKEFGRTPKTVINEARRLDLDLIAFGNEIRNTPILVLPHPRAHQRRFVLGPLSEIAPDVILPGQTKTVSELLAALPPDPLMSRVAWPVA